ncbi:hypothetical protein BKA69DRAFT_1125433 [Paraphysoderma sedebokerense]|nr:hypothetical protein BKA69DRAFT_1125433 [Paraphysoderma sedebokerense]
MQVYTQLPVSPLSHRNPVAPNPEELLEQCYQMNKNPNDHNIYLLAVALCASESQIQAWFSRRQASESHCNASAELNWPLPSPASTVCAMMSPMESPVPPGAVQSESGQQVALWVETENEIYFETSAIESNCYIQLPPNIILFPSDTEQCNDNLWPGSEVESIGFSSLASTARSQPPSIPFESDKIDDSLLFYHHLLNAQDFTH